VKGLELHAKFALMNVNFALYKLTKCEALFSNVFKFRDALLKEILRTLCSCYCGRHIVKGVIMLRPQLDEPPQIADYD
jgi:hypothetical protein